MNCHFLKSGKCQFTVLTSQGVSRLILFFIIASCSAEGSIPLTMEDALPPW
ncbi:MAG: hypothetical protein IPK25_09370 [Saprospiraceae bacterium]|nr:hypothetical protein [Saprospiraceae bacterium]